MSRQEKELPTPNTRPVIVQDNNNNNNKERLSTAPFHVKHDQLR